MTIKTVRIPLVGNMNQRGIDGVTNLVTLDKDQRFEGVFFNVVTDSVSGTKTVAAEKRPGMTAVTVDSGTVGALISDDHLVTAFSDGSAFLVYYNDIVSCGSMAITEVPVWVRRVNFSDEYHYMISGNSGDFAYYLPVEATAISTAYTGDTHSNTTIDGILPSTDGMYVGQLLTGTDLPAGTRIATITSATAITITQAATGTTNDLALTRTHLAKIIDADFPSETRGPFVDLDGYLFIADVSGFVWHSDLNSITSWTPTNFIRASIRPDTGVGLFKHKNLIGYFGSLHVEFFYNAGNPSGSVLSRTNQYSEIGSGGSILEFGHLLAESGDALDAENNDNLTTEGNFAAVRSFYELGDQIFFFGSLGQQLGIWEIGAFPPKKLSGPSQDYIFKSSGAVQSIEPFATASGVYLQVRSGVDYSLLYHVDTGVWGESGLPAGFLISPDGNLIDTVGSGGKRYEFDFSSGNVFTDDGASYTALIQTARRDYGTGNRKSVVYYELNCDRQSGGTATLEVSDDDFQTWRTIGTFDCTLDRPRIYLGGSFVGGRAERIKHSSNTAFRALSLTTKLSISEY